MIAAEEICLITNRIAELLVEADWSQSTRLRQHNHMLALRRSCDFLERFDGPEGKEFFRKYERAVRSGDAAAEGAIPGTRGGAVGAVSQEIGHFRSFLRREQELLTIARMDESLANWIVTSIEKRIDRLLEAGRGAKQVEAAIGILAGHTCSRSRALREKLSQGRWRYVLLTGFGGLGLIAANLAAVGMLTDVGIGASTGLGGSLTVAGISALQ